MTECSKCGLRKPEAEFYHHNGKRHGNICRECKRKYARQRVSRGDEYRYALKSKYGLTPEQYQALFDAQSGRCWICEKKSHKRLAVDHNHRTGVVRGLLCGNCNYMLGVMHDNARLLTRAGGYLDSPPAIDVIGVHRVPGAPPLHIKLSNLSTVMEETK